MSTVVKNNVSKYTISGRVRIKNTIVGLGHTPFIVAEAGINHNGSIKNALKMIEIAKKSGANAIKFQTFKAEEFIADRNQMFTYKSQGKKIIESMYDLHKRHEFSRDEWARIKKKCDEEKIIFFSTAQNPSDLNLLMEFDVPAIKVGSDDFTNIPLLKNYAKTGLPIIVSCGMSTLIEVYEALEAIGSLDGYPTILLLTTSEYPTPPENVNLRKLETLTRVFPSLPIGLSDHTIGTLASSTAIAFGACLFEKHFTLDRNLPGPDHWFAEDPGSLKEWVRSIRTAFAMMGNPTIKPTKAEYEMRTIARRSIVAIREIKKSEILNSKNIGLRRPGTGLSPKLFEQISGLRSTRKINKGSLLKFGDFK